MSRDANGANLERLLADPESWGDEERRFMEAEFRRQLLAREALPTKDTNGRARIFAVIESIEMALQRSNSSLAAVLADLPDQHLLDVLRRVFAQRRPNPEEDAFNRNRFFLGGANQMLDDDGVTWGAWKIGAVAYPDRTVYGDALGPDWGFCQWGECQSCSTRVRSNVKEGVCPVCGSSVGMT